MAIATTARPLVSLALPEKGASRLAMQFGIALLGTLALTLSAKTKVMLGPVDLSLQTLVVLLIAVSFGIAVRQPNEPYLACFKRADMALYKAKDGGRKKAVFAGE